MFASFSTGFDTQAFDRRPFVFGHTLMGHEALSLENLSKVLPRLNESQVMYSKSTTDLNTNFDRAHLDNKNNRSLAETIESIRTSDSYIMVRSPETDPSFQGLFKQLMNDVSQVIGSAPIQPTLYLFIASPGAFTPFHIDRYSTLLFQFRGTKQVSVFPQFDPRVVEPSVAEAFVDHADVRPQFSESIDSLGHHFNFKPGEGLHIPFVSGHYVKNGMDDVSISMSIIFRTPESQRWLKAMTTNHRLRKLGLSVKPVGLSAGRDRIKAGIYPIVSRLC